jgi:glycosyltransferase involved in cell wall biosynthesis
VTVRTLLVAPGGGYGEGVYTASLGDHPPAGVEYVPAGGFHEGAPGAPCQVITEVFLNQVVHRAAIPDMGFRALRLKEEFDLVHVHAHPVRLAGLGSTPLVMSEGSSAAVYLGEYLGWDDERLARGFRRARHLYRTFGIRDRLLALGRVSIAYVFSEWARGVNLRWGADPAKLRVLPPGFPTPPESDRSGHDTFTLLFAGGDFERKGGFELLEAFDELRREHRHLRLALVGCDPSERNPDRLVHSWVDARRRERALSSLAEMEREGVATIAPWTDRAGLDRSFALADAFVMPSHAEGFGFTNVEAMSHGLPVITSAEGPAAEIVDDERTGLLVRAGDVSALRDAIARLVSDRAAAGALGSAARTAFLERFTIERFRAGLAALYDEALAR